MSLNVFVRQSLTKLNMNEPKFYQVLDLGISASKPTQMMPHRQFDLILLFDKSWSMRGQKLRDAKAAAISLLEQDLPLGSRVAVIVFDTEVTVLVKLEKLKSKNDIEKIKKKIEEIKAGGWSALHTGLVETHKIAMKSTKTGQLTRIIVFTDGRPTDTKRIEDYEDIAGQLHAIRTPIDTVGLGPKHAVDLLTMIAEQTTGKYCYARHSGLLPSIVDDLTEAAVTSIIPRPTLTIELTHPEGNVSDLYQYEPTKGLKYSFQSSGVRFEAPIRAIEADKVFRACLRLLCNNPSPGQTAHAQKICTLSLIEGQNQHFQQDIFIDVVDGPHEMNPAIYKIFDQAVKLRKYRVDVTQRGEVETIIRDFGQETRRG